MFASLPIWGLGVCAGEWRTRQGSRFISVVRKGNCVQSVGAWSGQSVRTQCKSVLISIISLSLFSLLLLACRKRQLSLQAVASVRLTLEYCIFLPLCATVTVRVPYLAEPANQSKVAAIMIRSSTEAETISRQ